MRKLAETFSDKEAADKGVREGYAQRKAQGVLLQEKLKEFPAMAAGLDDLKEKFEGIKLCWIRFTDGTEIGSK